MIALCHKVISNVQYDLTIASGSEKVLLRSTVSSWAGGLRGNIRHNK